MAGEVGSKIEFGNNVIQEQAVWQMLPIILSKRRSKDQPLSEKEHHQIKELEILWDKSTDPSHVVSFAAVGVFVELVSQNILEFNHVMNGFLNQASTTRHLLGPIHGVTELLCLKIKNNAANSLQYSLRSTPHPYVAMLASSPEAWAILLREIEAIFGQFLESSAQSVFAALDAFFKYVLFNPNADYAISRTLHSLLLKVATEVSFKGNQDVLDSILDLVRNRIALYKRNATSLCHSVSLCHETLQWILKKDEELLGM